MSPDHLRDLKIDDVLRKRLAKWMAQFCFRNTKLEELHDRISDEEMKALMIDCADHCYAFLCILFSTQGGNSLIDTLSQNDQVPHWQEPEIPKGLIEAAKLVPSILHHRKRETVA